MLHQGIKPIIIDNSTVDYQNEAFCAEQGLIYSGTGQNLGLSKAYNIAISLAPGDVDYFIWLDDDSILPADFLRKVESYIKQYPKIDVFVPVVRSLGSAGFLSPSRFVDFNTYRINAIEELAGVHFSAINSGMVVKKTIYKEFEYDETLFLDCLDHDFMAWIWEHNKQVLIMRDVAINQNFSGDQKRGKRQLLKRFGIFSKDYRAYRKKHHCSMLKTELYLAKRFLHIILV